MRPLLLTALLLASTAGAQVQKWEYALYHAHIATVTLENNKNPPNYFQILIGDKFLVDSNSVQLFKRLGVDTKTAKHINDGAMLLNYFGSRGWELVSVTSTKDKDGEDTSLYFKRPVSK